MNSTSLCSHCGEKTSIYMCPLCLSKKITSQLTEAQVKYEQVVTELKLKNNQLRRKLESEGKLLPETIKDEILNQIPDKSNREYIREMLSLYTQPDLLKN